MANPRQRRKLRSGSSTTPSAKAKRESQKKLVRAPTIKGAKVIQENWDPKLTVRQNYQKLGLMGNLSLRDSGGAEKRHDLQSAAMPETTDKRRRQGMARVERDAEGKIISVEMDKSTKHETAWGLALNSDDDEDEEDEAENEDVEAAVGGSEKSKQQSDVMHSLEELSKTVQPVPRFTSLAEKTWLHRLVAKHGSDVAAMSRDKTDNIWQKTEGEIKKAMKKAGGLEALQG